MGALSDYIRNDNTEPMPQAPVKYKLHDCLQKLPIVMMERPQ